jgi:hypothetical protein
MSVNTVLMESVAFVWTTGNRPAIPINAVRCGHLMASAPVACPQVLRATQTIRAVLANVLIRKPERYASRVHKPVSLAIPEINVAPAFVPLARV